MEETETVTMENLCRVCLNYAENMTPLNKIQEDPQNLEENPTISQLLEKVMKVKLVVDENCPSSICGTCLDILKVCRDFQVLFSNSQDCLRQCLNQNVIIGENDNANGVDLIFGNNKFSLDEVVILEEQVDETDYLERLIDNLNGAVSVEVVCKSDVKLEDSTKSENVVDIILDSEGEKDMSVENGNNPGGNNEINEFDEASLPYQITIVTKDDINWTRSQCDLCPSAFTNKDKLMKHVFAQHCDHLRNDLCQDCAYSFASNKIKVPETPVLDDEDTCTRCTNCQADLNENHSENSDKRYACEICNITYTHCGSLKAHHEAVHKNERRNKLCMFCGRGFVQLSALEYHMRTHKKYKCSLCPRAFDDHSSHKRHLATHAKIRPYRCSICHRAFVCSDEKQKHELIHCNFTPFACGDCDASFRTLYERRLHQVETHHDVVDRTCQYCDANSVQDTSSEVQLQVNLKDAHDIKAGTA